VRRIAAAAVLVLAGVVSWATAPTAEPAALGELPPARPPGALGCVLRADRDGQVTVGIAGNLAAGARVSAVAGGTIVGDVALPGEAAVSSSDLGVSGFLGGVVELDPLGAGAGVLSTGAAGTAAAACTPPASGRLVAAGGSTRSRESLTLVVSNPYALDAVAAVRLGSEAGTESVAGIEAVFVPARTTITRDLSRLAPLRELLSVGLTVERGALHAALVETGEADTMIAEAVAPAPAWWVVLPPYTTTPGRVVVVPEGEAPVDVQLDTFGDGGAGSRRVTLAVGEQLSLPVGELGPGVDAVAVAATADVTVSAVFDGSGFRAGGPAASVLASDWTLGPATGTVAVWVLVPGDIDATVEVDVAGTDRTARASAPAGALTQISVPPSAVGYTVRASTGVAVAGTSLAGTTLAYSTGVPLGAGY